MKAATNLASRPFRNERLPWLIATALAVLGLGLTAAHARFLRQLLSGDEARIVRQVRDDEARVVELEAALAAEPPIRIDAVERARLRGFKELVDRRVFPWRRLLADLEEALPGDVRLTRIAPSESRTAKTMVVNLSGEARSKDAAFGFAEALGATRAFANPVLLSLADEGPVTKFELEVEFTPSSVSPAAPSPSPAAVRAQGGGER